MYCLSVGRSFLPVADHQAPHDDMPALTQEVSASWLGVARFNTRSLWMRSAGRRPMMNVRQGELWGVLATTRPFCISPSGAGAVLTAAPFAADGLRAGHGCAGIGGASCASRVYLAPALVASHMPDQSSKSDSVMATYAAGVWTRNGRPYLKLGLRPESLLGLNCHSCEPTNPPSGRVAPSALLQPAQTWQSHGKVNSVAS